MSAASRHSIAASVRWFALVYTLVAVGVTALAILLVLNKVDVPSVGLNAGAFIGTVYAAGHRFAAKNDGAWSGSDRNVLAALYTLAAALVSLALAALLAVSDPAFLGVVADVWAESPAILGGAMFFVAVSYFAAARFSLFLVARKVNQK